MAALAIGAVILRPIDTADTLAPAGRPGASAPAGVNLEGPGVDRAGKRDTELPAQLDPVSPVSMNAADIAITTEDLDSPYNRWLRGEWDSRPEGILSETEEAELRAQSYRLDPDPSLAMESRVPGLAPNPGAGFTGIDFNETGGSVPPDLAIAVGPDHIITVANVALEILDKNGTSLFGPTSGGSFFSGLAACTSGLYDPDVLFDEEHERYLVGIDQGSYSSAGGYCLAISQTSNPLGAWYLYFFNVNTATEWLDYPHAGIGDDYIVFGGNMFSMAGAYVEGRMWALEKSALYSGGAVSANQKTVPNGNSTPQPLNLHGIADSTWPTHGNDVYVLSEVYNGQHYPVYRWDVVAGSVTTVGTADLGAGSFPILSIQNGGSNIAAGDWRPLGFEYRNGYGWTSNTISCNPGAGTVNCVRWAQVDLATGSVGPQGVGTIASDGEYRTYPAIAANRCNDMAIGYSITSASSWPSVTVTGRVSTDPAGTVGSEALIKGGELAYVAFDAPPRRWGDYTGMAIDPDGATFWYLGEYSKATGDPNGYWGSYVVPLTFASCATNEIFSDGFENGTQDQWN